MNDNCGQAAKRAEYQNIKERLRSAGQLIALKYSTLNSENAREGETIRPSGSPLTLAGFERSLSAGEYELAWLALVSIAGRNHPNSLGWESLAQVGVDIWSRAEHLDQNYLEWVRHIVHDREQLRHEIAKLATLGSDSEVRFRATETIGLLFENNGHAAE